MNPAVDVAGQVLRLEQRLEAYEKLHAEELAELRQVLNDCKRAIAAMYNEAASTSDGVLLTSADRKGTG